MGQTNANLGGCSSRESTPPKMEKQRGSPADAKELKTQYNSANTRAKIIGPVKQNYRRLAVIRDPGQKGRGILGSYLASRTLGSYLSQTATEVMSLI